MSIPPRVSVAVVGGSISGLMAARALHERGVHDFVVLDRKSQVGEPLKCGEAVEANVFDELFGLGSRYPFVKHTANTHQVAYRDFLRPLVDVPQLTFYETDRPEFERWLAEPVRSRINLSTSVRRIDRDSRDFRIDTTRGRILARSVILCCGAQYQLPRQLGLVSVEPALGYACGEVHAVNPRNKKASFLWHVLDDGEGYGWVFPKHHDGYNLGVLSFRPEPLQNWLAAFKQRHAIETSPVKRFGGRFPQNGPIGCTIGESVLACGDAAGMVFAATGEGIRYALLSGQMAGTVMADGIRAGDTRRSAMERYERMWQQRFGHELEVGVKVKRLIISLRNSGNLAWVLRVLSDRRIADFMLGRNGRAATFSLALARVLEYCRNFG